MCKSRAGRYCFIFQSSYPWRRSWVLLNYEPVRTVPQLAVVNDVDILLLVVPLLVVSAVFLAIVES
jgi:hypothetical protein